MLLPISFPVGAPRVVHQAAYLARHFNSEILLLHVVTPVSYPAGVLERGHELTERDLHATIIQHAQKDLDQALRSELEGIVVRRLLLKGDPAHEIMQTARDEKVDLIAMSTHSHAVLYRFLLGSVAAKVLHNSDCQVWTDTHPEDMRAHEFAIRKVLCAVDLSDHSCHTVSRAAQMATQFDAQLAIVHITAGVKTSGPGGSHVDPEWQKALVGYAAKAIAKLQEDVRSTAEVIIDSGNVHKLLQRAAEQTQSDLLVIGHLPAGGHLGANGSGYAIIRDSHVPVLSL
ncbi:MAG: universal stress protein [Steroidobacteraceae bacterium]